MLPQLNVCRAAFTDGAIRMHLRFWLPQLRRSFRFQRGHSARQYRSALGSARETIAGLDVAAALGYVEPPVSDLPLIANTLRKVC